MVVKRHTHEVICDSIKALVKEWGEHPYDINNGNCETFAMEIQERHPKVEVFWGDELLSIFPPTFIDPSPHCFLRFQDRYYDAEEPDGTLHPCFLPFYVRMSGKEDMIWLFDWLEKSNQRT